MPGLGHPDTICDEIQQLAGTSHNAVHSCETMTKYRFVTPHRAGKWYPDLELAQRCAEKIGAGFFERLSGRFIAYRGTLLERLELPDQAR